MFQSALHALLPRLPPVLPPARETSRTMCANLNARCPSVHPALPPLSHLVVICRHLPPTTLPQGGGRGHAAQTVAPLQTGCKICLAGTSLLESRRMRGWRNSPGRRAGDRPTCPQVEKVNELGHSLCCRGDQEQVKGKAEDPILGRKTSLITSSPLYTLLLHRLYFTGENLVNKNKRNAISLVPLTNPHQS